MQDSWQLKVGQYFVTKDTEEFSQFTDLVVVVSTLCQETKKLIWTERSDSREHQNWARIGSHNQLPTR